MKKTVYKWVKNITRIVVITKLTFILIILIIFYEVNISYILVPLIIILLILLKVEENWILTCIITFLLLILTKLVVVFGEY